MTLADITGSEVAQAIAECDRLGRGVFLQRYGFGQARRYLLSHGGKFYDSKAIVGAAHGYLPGQEPLTASAFSVGVEHAAGLLRSLGFTIVDTSVESTDPTEELVSRIARLRVDRASGRPALYQPITLLWAIGRARRGEARVISWQETAGPVQALLERHGLRGERPRPDYPIAALRRAGLWVLHDHAGPAPAAHGDSALRRWFAENQPSGGLTQQAYDILRCSGDARISVIDMLLCTYFDGLDYGPLLVDVGLYDDTVADDVVADDTVPGAAPPTRAVTAAAQYERWCRLVEHRETENHGAWSTRTSRNPIRSGAARRAVLLRSDGNCENPNCTGQPADVTDDDKAILEVDHVMDLALDGRDHPSQMVALCPNCHAMKTRGRAREQLRTVLLDIAMARHRSWSASEGTN